MLKNCNFSLTLNMNARNQKYTMTTAFDTVSSYSVFGCGTVTSDLLTQNTPHHCRCPVDHIYTAPGSHSACWSMSARRGKACSWCGSRG